MASLTDADVTEPIAIQMFTNGTEPITIEMFTDAIAHSGVQVWLIISGVINLVLMLLILGCYHYSPCGCGHHVYRHLHSSQRQDQDDNAQDDDFESRYPGSTITLESGQRTLSVDTFRR